MCNTCHVPMNLVCEAKTIDVFNLAKTFVMDYEGYTFVFLSKYKQEFFIKM